MNLKSGIKLLSESEGTGQPVSKGDKVTVRLNGWLNKGDSIQDNYVVDISIGTRDVIAGIEYSLEGMKRGGKRKVRISPHLGYRDKGVQDRIPPNSVLIYEIEVIDVKKAGK